MKGMLLGHVGAVNITKVENRLQLECVLYGEGYCVNPSTSLFTLTMDFDEYGEQRIRAEANNKALTSIWSWMEASKSTNLSQLIGRPVIIQVGDDEELVDFQIISEEDEKKILETNQKVEEPEAETTTGA